MLKKSLIILCVFCMLVLISGSCFAMNIVNDTKNVLEDVGNNVQSMVDDAGNSMESMKDGISNVMSDMGNEVHETTDNIENDMSNNTVTDAGMTNNDDDYSATRTSASSMTEELTNSGTGSAFVWVVLSIAAIIIVALVWYYGTQTEDKNNL